MGEDYLRQQAGNIKKRGDLAVTELGDPLLFQRPEVLNTLYTVEPDQSESLQLGEYLYAVRDSNQRSVAVLRNHKKVAHIGGASAQALMDLLNDQQFGGIVVLRIARVGHLSGIGSAEIVRSVEANE